MVVEFVEVVGPVLVYPESHVSFLLVLFVDEGVPFGEE